MKSIFVKANIVVSVGTAHTPGVVITCGIPGAEEHSVGDNSPVDVGWSYAEVDGVPMFTEPTPEAPKVSPVQFKLLFTPPERVAMSEAKATDAIMQDFFNVVDDPRLTYVDLSLQSTKDAINYLISKNLLTQERGAEVLSGVLK